MPRKLSERTLTSHVLDVTPDKWGLYTHRQTATAITVALTRLGEYRVKAVIATRRQLLAEIAPAPADVNVGKLDELASEVREEIRLEAQWAEMAPRGKDEEG
jgi:hypothetical protein